MVEVDESKPKLILKLRVPSKSHPGTYHIVEIYDSGDTRCDESCKGYQMRQHCSHCDKAKEYLKKIVSKF